MRPRVLILIFLSASPPPSFHLLLLLHLFSCFNWNKPLWLSAMNINRWGNCHFKSPGLFTCRLRMDFIFLLSLQKKTTKNTQLHKHCKCGLVVSIRSTQVDIFVFWANQPCKPCCVEPWSSWQRPSWPSSPVCQGVQRCSQEPNS